MNPTFRLWFFLSFMLAGGNLSAQDLSSFEETPVKLEYVAVQNADDASAGAFVVKNNYPTKDLSSHQLVWELSFEGKVAKHDAYQLGAIQPSETKYIDLDKLFDPAILAQYQGGLLSLYAEIQEKLVDDAPLRIIGESVVLAETEKEKISKSSGERYQVINLGGARLYRIANGNSITVGAYNQIVGLDLGEGNLLAGPIRPIVKFETTDVADVTSKTYRAQSIIDRNGPLSIGINPDALEGVISYRIENELELNIPFTFDQRGLTLGLELYGTTSTSIPSELSIEIPIRQVDDSLSYLGQERLPTEQVVFGDTRLGFHAITFDSTSMPSTPSYTYTGAHELQTPRGNVVGSDFSFQLLPSSTFKMLDLGVTRHEMNDQAKVLLLQRALVKPRKRSGIRPNRSAYSIGLWQLRPKTLRD